MTIPAGRCRMSPACLDISKRSAHLMWHRWPPVSRNLSCAAMGPGDHFTRTLPGTVPTVHVLMYLQAQHLDTDFYDERFAGGAYLPTHATHQARWHGQ